MRRPRPHAKLQAAFFPIDLTFAVAIESKSHASFCTGFIGSDGLLGAGLSLDDRVCLYGVTVVTSGRAFTLPMSRLRDLLLQVPELRKRALAYDQFFLAQVQQTAACGALHELPGRLSSCLMRLRAHAGNEFNLTQSELAQMLGVRRTSITESALALQRAGAIGYQRGAISLLSARKLRATSCGCHEEIATHYARLFNASFDDD